MNTIKTINKVSVKTHGEDEYVNQWRNVASVLEDNGMYWFSYIDSSDVDVNYISEDDERWKQYVTLSVLDLDKKVYNDISHGTLMLNKMLNEVVSCFYNLTEDKKEDFLERLGFSTYERSLIINSPKSPLYSYLTRFDFIINNNNKIKCLEFNSDMPKGIIESGLCTDVVCDFNGVKNYNRLSSSLVNLFKYLKDDLIKDDETLYFSCLKDDLESKLTLDYIRSNIEGLKHEFVYLDDLQVSNDGLFDKNNNKIKYWFKIYPYEYWEKDGKDISNNLKSLIESRELIVVNPPISHLVQNKNLYQYLWCLLEDNDLGLGEESLNIIKEYLIPTYTNSKRLEGKDFVVKPVYGGNGEGVNIVLKDTNFNNNQVNHLDKDYVYQEYIEGKEAEIQTWDGSYIGTLVLFSYIINGDFCAIHGVVGDKVTDDTSYFVSYSIK